MLKRLSNCVAGLGFLLAGTHAEAQLGDILKGGAILLTRSGPYSVNKDGLLIVVIPDSGGRPPRDLRMQTQGDVQLQGKARVRVGPSEGPAPREGGQTWILYKPPPAGVATIKVFYTDNTEERREVERTFKVTVEDRSP